MKEHYFKLTIAFFFIFSFSLNAQINFVEDASVPFDGVNTGDVVFADIDGDNDQDVLISGDNSSGLTINLYTNDGFGGYTLVAGTPFPGLDNSDAAFADIDGDNDLDLIISGRVSAPYNGLTKLYTNDGSGNFTEVLGTPFDDLWQSTIDFADIDGDNDLDVLLTGTITNTQYVTKLYSNDGNGVFTEVLGTPFIPVGTGDSEFADIDGDNDLDVLITGIDSSTSHSKLYSNDGNGIFTEVTGTPFTGVAFSSISFADVDGDNDLDVFISGADWSNGGMAVAKLYINDGNGNYTEVIGTPFTGAWVSSIDFADVDGDNDEDILITGNSLGGIRLAELFSNDGFGNFIKVGCIDFEGVMWSSVAFSDVDGDNDKDILITGNGNVPGTAKLYVNESQPGGSNGAFITTWETTTNDESITIPTTGAGYNYDIDWGDGNTTTGETGNATHSYVTAGTHQVTISGTFPRIYFNGAASAPKIISIEQWGCNPWISMRDAFYGCTNLVVNATDTPNLSNTTSLLQMFVGATSLGGGTGNWDWSTETITTIGAMFLNATSFNEDIGSWDVSNVTQMTSVFYGASIFNQYIGSWDTSSATTMETMFKNATMFNQDIGSWTVSNVTQMQFMFSYASDFNQNIGNWDMSSVTTTNGMFHYAIAFNQDLGNWDVSNVLYFTGMFQEATAFNQDIGNWNTSSALAMTGMFNNAINFNQDIGNWDTSNVWTFSLMFINAISFDQDLGNWDVSSINTANSMFAGVTLSIANYDSLLIGWDAQNLNSSVGFSGGFSQYCAGEAARANMIATDSWNITDGGSATPIIDILPNQNASISFTFPVITGTNLSGGEAYYTGTNGTGAMYNSGDVINYADFPAYPITLYIYDNAYPSCSSEENFELIIADASCAFITTWETTTNNEYIYIGTAGGSGASHNYTVDWGDGTIESGVVSDVLHYYVVPGTYQVSLTGIFPTISVASNQKIKSIDQWGCNQWSSLAGSFSNCYSLVVNALDTPNLTNVTDMSGMFFGDTSLGGGTGNWNWDTSNVTNLEKMFMGATNFNQDIGNWNTSNVINMVDMFNLVPAFNQDIGGWNTGSVLNMTSMFSSATAFNQDIGSWETGNVELMTGMFRTASSFNQNIGAWDVSNVTSMQQMFEGAIVFNQDIGAWNTGNVTTMSAMFFLAGTFNQDIGAWNTMNVTTMNAMFLNAVSFDQDIGNWNVANLLVGISMFNGVTLSTPNYDSLLIGWNAQSLNPNVTFSGGLSQYCAGETSRANMIASDNWNITDGGFAGSIVNDLADQNASGSFIFPVITGTNLSGNEMYYTGPGGTGTAYNAGDIINYTDFPSYPITLYIYDSPSVGCESEESFELTINDGCEFITTWRTTTVNETIIIPTTNSTGEIYNYNVDWGDGNTTMGATANATHVYATAGDFQVTITGTFPRIYFPGGNPANTQKIRSIDQWGCNPWATMHYAFQSCANLVVNATDTPNLSNATDTSYMFLNATVLGGGTGNWDWDMSTITGMKIMFGYTTNFNQDISSWDTSNVIDMSFVFQFSGFNQNINTWDTSSVTTMVAMFNSAANFNQPLDNWNTSNVTDMRGMFESALVFDQDIGNWDTSNVTVFNGMFAYGSFNQDIGNWDTSSAIDINAMFYNATAFDQDLGNWNVENVTNAGSMFNNVTLSTSNYDSLLIGWNAQNLNPSVSFSGGNSKYCAGEAARANMIASDGWGISDSGSIGITVNDLADQTVSVSYNLPVISGTNLSGNEAYYTGPNGTGTMYNAGDIINYADFPAYPITLYIYDNAYPGCSSEESFELTITDGCEFITTWQTTTANESIIIPTTFPSVEVYNYDVDWGDGNTTIDVTANATHVYASAGDYQVTITGTFPRIYFSGGNPANSQKIRSIDQWGCNPWQSMETAFWNCTNLEINATDTPNLSNVTSMSRMFQNTNNLGNGTGNWNWDTSSILDLSQVFEGAVAFNKDITTWNTSNVTNMSRMFAQAQQFNQDIDSWNVALVTIMSGMFDNASSFNQDLNSWDTGNVTDMFTMFRMANNFNGNVTAWDTSNVTDMGEMFAEATIFNQDIGNWNTSNVTDMNSMFFRTDVFNQDLSNWNTGNVIRMDAMFFYALLFNQDIGGWDTSSVTNMAAMFHSTDSFNQDIGSWETSNVTRMDTMFATAQVFNQDIGNWNTGNVLTMDGMFAYATNFDQDLGAWDVTNLQTASIMFFEIALSIANYDSLLIGWNAQNLKPNVYFGGGSSQYCEGESARANMIASDNWNITDGGFAGSTVDDLPDQMVTDSFTFPTITGINLSGNEAYFTGPNGTGTMYSAGDIINYSDFPSYPITIYIYDFASPDCYSEENFELIITPTLQCTALSSPTSGSTNIAIDTDLTWTAVPEATGYILTVGTSSGGSDLENGLDAGNVLTYDLPADLPENTEIYVSIIPYNLDGDATDCTEESFTTEDLLFPPNCTILNSPTSGSTDVSIGTDLNWNAAPNATGYVVKVGTISGGSDILNAADVGNILTYNLSADLPENTIIYVTVIPYNSDGDAVGCTEESFTTEDLLFPPSCTTLSSPISGSIDVLIGTDLSWDAVAGASGYVLTVGTTSDGTDILNAVDVGDVLTYNFVADLPEFTEIFVLIIPYNSDGDASGCSEESFTTEDLLFPPNCTTLNSPTSGSTSVLVDTDLSWDVAPNATGYFLTVGTTFGGADILNTLDVGNILTYALATDLPENTVIYVSVIPYNADGDAIGCAEETFTTEDLLFPPECSSLSDPLAGAINIPIDTDFNWNAVANATGYRINIGTNSIFFGEFDVGNALTYDLAFDLPENTEIHVRIIPYNLDGDAIGGCTSEIFTTGDDLMPPACTTLSSPVSGATNVLIGTDLTWNAIAEATGYVLTVGTTSGGTEILNAIDVGNVFSYNLTTDLPENTIIYITVIPYNTDGEAIGCTEESFTTEDFLFPPNCTTLSSPISGSTDVSVGTNLTWITVPEATGYTLTIGSISGASDILNELDVGNVLTYDIVNVLPEDSVIYITIIPYNADGEAIGCTEESFITENLLFPPNCTSLNSPSNGLIGVRIDTDLMWYPVPGATGYLLTLGTTSGGIDILNSLDVGNVLFYDIVNILPEDAFIYVTIITYNADGEASGCIEESFETQNASDRIPKFFTPNNDGTNDNWIVPNELNVISEIIIYNRYGKILDKISNSPTDWGWDGTYNGVILPSSDYWYSIYYKNGKVLNGHFSLKR